MYTVTGIHPCVLTYTLVYWPTTVYTQAGPNQCTSVYLPELVYTGLYMPAYTGVYLPVYRSLVCILAYVARCSGHDFH